MTMATVIVEIGFSGPGTGTYLHLDDTARGRLDTATLAPDDLWVDVTEWVASGSSRRGATRADGPTLRYEAGTATIVLRNEDRRFDPTNLSGPYVAGGVTQVEPMRAVRIRATWNGVTYPIWRGFTDNWQVAYDGPNASFVTLTCTDAFKVFASYDRGAITAVGAGEDTGARINRILDSAIWPDGDRVVETGDVTVQSTTLAGNTLTELLLTADSELGEFYMDAQGRTVFRRRLGIQEDSRSTFPAACFGTQPSGVQTTVNRATNPSAGTDLIGWAGGGFAGAPTLTRSSTRAMFGTHSVLATWATTPVSNIPQVTYSCSGLTPGRAYTFSVYAYVPSGSPSVAVVIAGTGPFGAQTEGVVGQWVRLSVTTAVLTAAPSFQVWALSDTTAGQQVWLDGLQVEEGGTATAYVDGDQAGGEWDGVAHASTSRRLPELPYSDVEITYDDQTIYNLITVGRTGGTEQTAESSASRTAYLTRTYGRSDLLLQTDPEALRYAEQLLTRCAMPELRFSSLELKPRTAGYEDALYPQALGREIGDRIRVIQRPPGGGDPIQRDVWVRGVEHQIGKAMDWTTTFVLQSAPDREDITDTFSRVTANGWGTSNSGDLWTPKSGTLAEYSTDGTFGIVSLSTLNTERHVVADLGHTDQDVLTWLTLPVTPTGAPINWGGLLRYVDINNYYWADVQVGTTGTLTLRLVKRVGGVATQITSAVSATTHSTTVPRILRTHIAGTHFAAKVWSSSGTEPTAWEVETTDSALTSGTEVGTISRLMTGNTNTTPVQFKFHNFFAGNVYAWD